jgi:leucine dehydrogenase
VSDLQTLIEEWDGHAVVTRFDRPTGAWIFIALHDPTLGMPVGGTRMKVYPTPADGLRDAQRLAEGMTHKWAAAGFPAGGGKAVIALSRPLEGDEREALLRRYGRLIASLKGAFGTGQDLGTTTDDMATIARETRYVHGQREGGLADPGPYTARGVLAAMRAVARHLPGEVSGPGSLDGLRVVVQGVGDVGGPLARMLAEEGVELVLTDVVEGRLRALAEELGARVVSPGEALDTPCDVFAPCAIGAVINRDTIPRLECRAVCGSANNQLERPEDADLLQERGILYAPDYVANSGGAIAFGLMGGNASEAEILERIDALTGVMDEILAEATREGGSPLEAARRRVARMLDERRPEARDPGQEVQA